MSVPGPDDFEAPPKKELLESIHKTLPDGKVVVDEMCECGRRRSDHGGLVGHGGIEGACPQFTWVRFIFEGEY